MEGEPVVGLTGEELAPLGVAVGQTNLPGIADTYAIVTSLVTVPLTVNQTAALVMYAERIGLDAFKASPVLLALNLGNPGTAMVLLTEDIWVAGRWTTSRIENRMEERALFLS